MKIGVLALQGDFERHQARLSQIGVENLQIRKPRDLQTCDGLILPGGESTTLTKLLGESGLYRIIPDFASQHPVFGTCAGLILIAAEVINKPINPLGLLNIKVHRNAYGRQLDSFADIVELNLSNKSQKIEAVFIRAPKISKMGEGVSALGLYKNDPVLVEKDLVLASTFHPELSDSTIIHRYFADKVKKHIRQ